MSSGRELLVRQPGFSMALPAQTASAAAAPSENNSSSRSSFLPISPNVPPASSSTSYSASTLASSSSAITSVLPEVPRAPQPMELVAAPIPVAPAPLPCASAAAADTWSMSSIFTSFPSSSSSTSSTSSSSSSIEPTNRFARMIEYFGPPYQHYEAFHLLFTSNQLWPLVEASISHWHTGTCRAVAKEQWEAAGLVDLLDTAITLSRSFHVLAPGSTVLQLSLPILWSAIKVSCHSFKRGDRNALKFTGVHHLFYFSDQVPASSLSGNGLSRALVSLDQSCSLDSSLFAADSRSPVSSLRPAAWSDFLLDVLLCQ